MIRRNSNTARIRALWPTTMESMVIAVMSSHAQRVELGKLLAQRGFDAEVQRHLRGGASSANAGQPDSRRIPFHGDQLDIAPISIEIRPDPIEHGLDTFLRNHGYLPLESSRSRYPGERNRDASHVVTGSREFWRIFDSGVQAGAGSGGLFRSPMGKTPAPLTYGPIFRAGIFRSDSESGPGSDQGVWRRVSGSNRFARAPERAAIVR